jgi:hypothetical protein
MCAGRCWTCFGAFNALPLELLTCCHPAPLLRAAAAAWAACVWGGAGCVWTPLLLCRLISSPAATLLLCCMPQLLPGLHVTANAATEVSQALLHGRLPLAACLPDTLHAATNCTFALQLLPGLHVCGEVLDVFGRIGGFNFLWAWVTGVSAACYATRRILLLFGMKCSWLCHIRSFDFLCAWVAGVRAGVRAACYAASYPAMRVPLRVRDPRVHVRLLAARSSISNCAAQSMTEQYTPDHACCAFPVSCTAAIGWPWSSSAAGAASSSSSSSSSSSAQSSSPQMTQHVEPEPQS